MWASMPSMLSISLPRSALKIEGPSMTAPGATDASAMRRIRMPMPPSNENLRSSSNRSPDGELTWCFAADQEGEDVAVRIQPAFGNRKQRSRQRKSLRHHHQRLKPLVERQLARRRRQRHHLAGSAGKALGKIEPQQLVDALEPDIDHRSVERDRLAVEPAARGNRLAVGAEHRRSLDIVEPGHLAPLVDDAAGKPASLVADGDEALALRVQPQAGQPAKAAKPRRENEPAAIFQRTEPHMRAIAGVE